MRLPTEKAHGIQIMNTCSALAQKGIDVELIISDLQNNQVKDAFDYYDLPRNFKITKLKVNNLRPPFLFFFIFQRLLFSIKVFILLYKSDLNRSVIYSRDEFVLSIFSLKFKNLFWEIHEERNNFFARIIYKKLSGIIAITESLREFSEQYIDKNKIVVIPDSVNLKKFKINENRESSRQKLNLPQYDKIITYIGSIGLYSWKGVDIFLEASNYLRDYRFLIVGGYEDEISNLKDRYKNNNVIFVERQNPSIIPLYQKASDVLVIPNKKGNIVSEKYTSPMKLFEYMASNVPILASDLSSLREILNDDNAVFFNPNDSLDMSKKIDYILNNQKLVEEKAVRAMQDVEKYTYEQRASGIINFIKKV